MIITNAKQLGTTPLRRDALAIIEAGYQSIALDSLFMQALKRKEEQLTAGHHSYNLTDYENIYVIGVGKGTAQAAAVLEKTLGGRLKGGAVIDVASHPLKKIKAYLGTHPLPSEQNIRATRAVVRIAQKAEADDLVICLIAGGGSALFCHPGNLTCLELQFISNNLLKAGATIQEINTVRKHASLIHGGYLAKYCHPATVLSLIVSDVPGDSLQMIASGPTVFDTTTKEEAQRIAKKYGLPPLPLMETPKDARLFRKVTNTIIASGKLTVRAMAQEAKKLGLEPVIYDTKLTGLAKDIGPALAKRVKPGQALLACGETQVIVTRPGKGGRNQDVVLSAIPHLKDESVIISAASDGKDNEPVAGAIADSSTSRAKLHELKIDPKEAVAENRGYDALHRLGDHLQTEKITANISDFMLIIRR